MIWRDCFDRPFIVGEDVIYGIVPNGEVEMRSGVVFEIEDDRLTISYNEWIGEDEFVYSAEFTERRYPDGKIPCLCKLK